MIITGIILLILLTLLPGLELRISIPFGILSETIVLPFGITLQGLGLNPILVFIICVTVNALLGPLVYLILDKFLHFAIQFQIINNIWEKLVKRTQRKIHPFVERYGSIGLALFIAIPLPGSGSYTGAMAAYLLGLSYKKFFLINTIGVILAGIIVTSATIGLIHVFG